jgi:hypothetical protein
MNVAKALCIAALAVPPLILGIASSSADTLERSLRDLTLGGPCYDFDPYDPYHLYGKYYPYSADLCRHRSLKRKRVVKQAVSHVATARCVTTNVKNFKSRC